MKDDLSPQNPIISKSSEEIIFKYVQKKTSVQLSSIDCFSFFIKAFPLRTCLSFSDPLAQDWPVSSLKPVGANIHPQVWPLCSWGSSRDSLLPRACVLGSVVLLFVAVSWRLKKKHCAHKNKVRIAISNFEL